MIRLSVRVVPAGVLFVLLAAATAVAQSTATVQGTITDSQNDILPGVSVTIRNTETGVERSVLTDGAGQYVAPSLAPGRYAVLVHLQGFADQNLEVQLEVALRLGYCPPETYRRLQSRVENVGRMLNGLIESLQPRE